MTELLKISGCDQPDRELDLIFVHGLDGNGRSTWQKDDNPANFWPGWLGDEFPNIGVWSLDYEANAIEWKGHSMPLYDRARNSLERFDLAEIGKKPIGFVCHSLGGLLVKQILRLANEFNNDNWQAVADQTRFIVFLSTPHSGADMANWINYIGKLLRTSVSVQELEAHNPSLLQLNDWYRNNANKLKIKTCVYCETRPTHGIRVVNETSANPGITGVNPIPLDADHITICKLVNKSEPVYQRVQRLLKETLPSTTPKTAGLEHGNSVKALQAFYQNCIDRWSGSRYALDTRFVDLTLLLDQGAEAQGPRWQAKSEPFQSLQQVLATTTEPLVLLGAPGCGKSTLLRHYELENAQAALAELEQSDDALPPLTFFIQLNDFKGPRPGDLPPMPLTWLTERWAQCYPKLPDLPALMQTGRITLLLDALNEIPYRKREVIQLWKDFLTELETFHRDTRVIFSCRSLDYSAPLSSKDRPVPQVRIESLSDDKVREFLLQYSPDYGETLWDNLKNTAQLNVFRLPYFLKMLIEQSIYGEIPGGRAALFTAFVRRLITREIENPVNTLFQAGELLKERDIQRLTLAHNGKTPCELPKRGMLIPKLGLLAFQMQKQIDRQESGLVKIDYDQALVMLDHPLSEKILEAGVAMSVLEQDLVQDQVFYMALLTLA